MSKAELKKLPEGTPVWIMHDTGLRRAYFAGWGGINAMVRTKPDRKDPCCLSYFVLPEYILPLSSLDKELL